MIMDSNYTTTDNPENFALQNTSNFTCFASDLSRDSVTAEAWSLRDDQDPTGVIAIGAILIIAVAVGIPWNAGVIVALIYNKFFKQPSTFLLFNLALVDFLTCVIIIPFQAVPGLAGGVYTLGNSDYTRCQSCQAGIVVIIWLLYSSLHLVSLMAVDRLIYIRKPLQYDTWVTVPRIAVVIVLIYVISLLVSIPPLFQFGAIEFSANVGTCTTVFGATTRVGPSFLIIVFFLVEACIPVGILIIANIILLVFVRKGIKNRFDSTYLSSGEEEVNKQAKLKYHNQQIRMVKVFGSIFVSNFLTWAPSVILIVIIGAIGISRVPPGIFGLVFLCFLLQSVIHPVLESLLSGKIRALVKKICCCCKKKKHANTTKATELSSRG